MAMAKPKLEKVDILKAYVTSAFLKPGGEYGYSLEVRMDPKDPKYAPVRKTILDANQAAYEAAVNTRGSKIKNMGEPIRSEADGYDYVKCKMAEEFKDGDIVRKRRPVVVDSRGKLVDVTKLALGEGSIVNVQIILYPYEVAGTKTAGVSLKMGDIQVLEYIPYSRKSVWGATDDGNFTSDADDDDDDQDETGEEDLESSSSELGSESRARDYDV